MSGQDAPGLSVVVAVQHAEANLPAILAGLRPEAHPDIEFLFCHTPADPRTPALVGEGANRRVLCAAAGSLIPALWRDGILAARGSRVATTTAHCIPAPDWVARLEAAGLDGARVALGGVIDNAPESDAMGWAAYLLRYAAFAPSRPAAEDVHEIAADNALYRRAAILGHPDLLALGFWEPSFHARFRAAGLHLDLDPALRVTQHNRYTAAQFARQRRAHGRAFGLARASRLTRPQRLLLTLASPGVPLVLLRRIRRAAGRAGLGSRFPRALPWLLAFLGAWSAGEAEGYAASLMAPKNADAPAVQPDRRASGRPSPGTEGEDR